MHQIIEVIRLTPDFNFIIVATSDKQRSGWVESDTPDWTCNIFQSWLNSKDIDERALDTIMLIKSVD